MCLKVVDEKVVGLPDDVQAAIAKKIGTILDEEGVAYDIGAYRDAPPGLRIWCGATVEATDLQALCPWLVWAYESITSEK